MKVILLLLSLAAVTLAQTDLFNWDSDDWNWHNSLWADSDAVGSVADARKVIPPQNTGNKLMGIECKNGKDIRDKENMKKKKKKAGQCAVKGSANAAYWWMMDAGSSGSRTTLAQVIPKDKLIPDEIKIMAEIEKFAKIETSYFEGNATLQTCKVDNWMKDLYGEGKKFDGFFMGATAGFRQQDIPTRAKKTKFVKKIVEDYFKTNGNKGAQIQARGITGQEEGLYAWLGINYWKENLKPDSKTFVSILEVGGASMQIATPVKEEASLLNDRYVVRLSKEDPLARVAVQAGSVLGYGNQKAYEVFDSIHKDVCKRPTDNWEACKAATEAWIQENDIFCGDLSGKEDSSYTTTAAADKYNFGVPSMKKVQHLGKKGCIAGMEVAWKEQRLDGSDKIVIVGGIAFLASFIVEDLKLGTMAKMDGQALIKAGEAVCKSTPDPDSPVLDKIIQYCHMCYLYGTIFKKLKEPPFSYTEFEFLPDNSYSLKGCNNEASWAPGAILAQIQQSFSFKLEVEAEAAVASGFHGIKAEGSEQSMHEEPDQSMLYDPRVLAAGAVSLLAAAFALNQCRKSRLESHYALLAGERGEEEL